MARHLVFKAMGFLSVFGLAVSVSSMVQAAPPTCDDVGLSFSEDFRWMVGFASYQDPDGDEEAGSSFRWFVGGQETDQG